MGVAPQLIFYVDENLPVRSVSAILTSRGHQVMPVQVGFKDQAILVTAEQVGAIIVTADVWFLRELFRLPSSHHRRYRRAGIVQVPGDWGLARPLIEEYLPIIEVTCAVRSTQVDNRIGVDLSKGDIRIARARP
jgi:hypothetical protein